MSVWIVSVAQLVKAHALAVRNTFALKGSCVQFPVKITFNGKSTQDSGWFRGRFFFPEFSFSVIPMFSLSHKRKPG
ncbi:hypothetical protein TSAR_005843 [Trichomalopsis sarcophagae]|uniref:Uncharacterized protein n=1 Tax=Trichomalopsis sarcophagae TaxID=543379 RepID=A0A232EDW7_9HYME|nr:hypothetical protein TSAR_005843 [Trichomalopsis sarcophagae]